MKKLELLGVKKASTIPLNCIYTVDLVRLTPYYRQPRILNFRETRIG